MADNLPPYFDCELPDVYQQALMSWQSICKYNISKVKILVKVMSFSTVQNWKKKHS